MLRYKFQDYGDALLYQDHLRVQATGLAVCLLYWIIYSQIGHAEFQAEIEFQRDVVYFNHIWVNYIAVSRWNCMSTYYNVLSCFAAVQTPC